MDDPKPAPEGRVPVRTRPRALLEDERRPTLEKERKALIFVQGVLGILGAVAYAEAEARARRAGVEPMYLRVVAGGQVLLAIGGLTLLLRTYWRSERSGWQVLQRFFGVTALLLLAAVVGGWLFLGVLLVGPMMFGIYQVASWAACYRILKAWRVGPTDHSSLSAFD